MSSSSPAWGRAINFTLSTFGARVIFHSTTIPSRELVPSEFVELDKIAVLSSATLGVGTALARAFAGIAPAGRNRLILDALSAIVVILTAVIVCVLFDFSFKLNATATLGTVLAFSGLLVQDAMTPSAKP